MRKPLFAIIPQFVVLPNCTFEENVATLCRSSLMRSIQSFEFDENLMLTIRFTNRQLYFDQLSRVTHLRISLWSFNQCIHLLNQLDSQLHSFTVTVAKVFGNQFYLISEMKSISCPHLKQVTMIMYHNFNNYESCQDGITPNHFIDGSILERDIVSYMHRLRQFNYHIRSILKNASHIKIDKIRQSFLKQQQPFDCVLDHFKNKYGQCQIYSLLFIGTRLDFISNRFPLSEYILKCYYFITL
ncbi:unnamed protein product [Rotaria sp. Silwood2]|nr:unnamed protein product [Rotaria sp. Silwood2]